MADKTNRIRGWREKRACMRWEARAGSAKSVPACGGERELEARMACLHAVAGGERRACMPRDARAGPPPPAIANAAHDQPLLMARYCRSVRAGY